MKKHLFLAVLAFMTAGPASAETTTFEEPMQERFRLDYCRYQGVDCGVAAAFAWCQQEGFTQIETYVGERDVRDTQRIGDGTTCRTNLGHTCDSFAAITCSRDGPRPAIQTGPGSVNYPERPDFGEVPADDEVD